MKMRTGGRKAMKMTGKKGALLFSVFLGCLMLSSNLFAATELSLTTPLSSGYVNGAFFEQTTQRSTGTGVIDSFVRISSNDLQVDGYNTSGRPLRYDENTSPTFTRDLLLVNVPVVNIGGIDYRQFLLDINQTGTDPLLSLDELMIWSSNTVYNNTTNKPPLIGDLGTPIYDLDGGGDYYILLNYNLNTGSGSGDMFAYILSSLFNNTNVYLYSMFGNTPPYGNNDGFEEWAVQHGTVPVPEPGTMMLLGSGLIGLAGWGRKKFRK